MRKLPALPIHLRRLLLGAALAVAAMSVTARPVVAQLVAVIVNGDPVTNFDVDQRSKLIQASTHKVPPRKEVIDELINEKLKIQVSKRYMMEGVDKEVDNAFTNMARRMRATPKDFTEQLAKQGIQPETIKSRIRAELVWSQIIRGRFQSSFLFNDKDLQARIDSKTPSAPPTIGYDYTLRPILFVVARGSPASVVEERRKEAEALRGRFQSCEQGIPLAPGMRYVAVRAQVVKSTAELPPALRDILEKTEVGKLTPPESTLQGIEVHAVCSKKQSDSDNAPAKREAREELFRERFESHSKQYLKELRSQAMIEYR